VCTFGSQKLTTNVVLVGNSHAGQWLPAVQQIAEKNNFKITTILASRCALAKVSQTFDTDADSAACSLWVKRVIARVIAMKPSLVVMTNRISTSVVGHDLNSSYALYGVGYQKVLEAWQNAGIHVLVLHDTPAPGVSIPDCIATAGSGYASCNGTRSEWLKPEPAQGVVAALGDPEIRFLDLTDHICDGNVCRAVTGGVITYFDGSHLTATYAATLAPYLSGPLLAMLPRRPAS
jgi:hypothetical protein